MRHIRLRKQCGSQSGQSLLETALLIPLLLLLVFNAINFGYYFIVCIHLASAPREGVQYSIQGFETPAHIGLANPGPSTDTHSVSYLTYHDMNTLTGSGTTAVRVCSMEIGLNNPGLSTQTAQCTSYGSAASPAFAAVAADPESPNFVLHRVDVQYTVTPLIKSSPFGLITPTLTFHRQVSMRAIP